MFEKKFIDWVEKQLGEKVIVEKEAHGDVCLPKFVFYNDDFSGYIDLVDIKRCRKNGD